MREEYRTVNGVTLHCVVAGTGPLVVLLHGFPEAAYSWRAQIPALAERFTVVAPDMRGYNTSSKPKGVENYHIERLVEDVVALIHSFGVEHAAVVGHDWGGLVAWMTALLRPDVVRQLVILNCPHPRVFQQHVLTNPVQARRSWYIGFFQLPWLPEWVLRRNDYAFLEHAFRDDAVHPDNFSDADIAAYKTSASQQGALTAMVNYYRALFRAPSLRVLADLDPVVRPPTLVVWGEQDFALGNELLDGLPRYVPDLTVRRIADASHWVQQDRPDLVNRYLAGFLA